MKLNVFSALYDEEQYKMPCSEAVAFLKQLDPAYHADKSSMHKVIYAIKLNEHTYISKLTETPAKAAAKIELFMKNPGFLPKSN
jgi:hypothetical protein